MGEVGIKKRGKLLPKMEEIALSYHLFGICAIGEERHSGIGRGIIVG